VIRFPLMQLASTPPLPLRSSESHQAARVSLIVSARSLHVPRRPGMVPPKLLLAATIGIWLVAGAAAAVNCLVDRGSTQSWRASTASADCPRKASVEATDSRGRRRLAPAVLPP